LVIPKSTIKYYLAKLLCKIVSFGWYDGHG
jgi:hypothetical protein